MPHNLTPPAESPDALTLTLPLEATCPTCGVRGGVIVGYGGEMLFALCCHAADVDEIEIEITEEQA